MKVLFIVEYPPLASDTAAQGYWLANHLKNQGIEVYVVSDGWHVCSEYRAKIKAADFEYLNGANPRFFSIDPLQRGRYGAEFEPHIPRLVNLALEVYQRYGFDMIYSNSLNIYAMAAFTVKEITKKPLIISHFGTNLSQILFNPALEKYFRYILGNTDLILSRTDQQGVYQQAGAVHLQETVPLGGIAISPESELKKLDAEVNIDVLDASLPMIMVMGNVDYAQGCHFFIKYLESIKSDFRLALSCYGPALSNLHGILKASKFGSEYLDFGPMPPWERVKMFVKAALTIPTGLVDVSGNFDPTIISEIMSIGKAPVILEVYRSLYPELLLNDSNSIAIHDLQRIDHLLHTPTELTMLGNNALKEYQNMPIASLVDVFKGVCQ